jgi:hypothetical protein
MLEGGWYSKNKKGEEVWNECHNIRDYARPGITVNDFLNDEQEQIRAAYKNARA